MPFPAKGLAPSRESHSSMEVSKAEVLLRFGESLAEDCKAHWSTVGGARAAGRVGHRLTVGSNPEVGGAGAASKDREVNMKTGN